MRKEPIAIISTDKHLQEANALELLDIAEQEIALAQEQGVDTVIWLGDILLTIKPTTRTSHLSNRDDRTVS